jgi:hypothetical protein
MNPRGANARTLAGKCLCGAVHYAVADEFTYAANCHCSNCRRATGSAFKPFAGIERAKLRLPQGDGNLMIFGDETGHDAHCKICGSLLYSVVRDGAFVHVAMGTLVDEPAIRPSAHIFVGSKASWFTITDDLPQYDGHVVTASPGPAHAGAPMEKPTDEQLAQLRRSFESCDLNGDGFIDPDEFHALLQKLDGDVSHEECLLDFEIADTEGDGYIGFKEFIVWWTS